MPEKSLAQKLFLKPGYRAALVNPPAGYDSVLDPLPEGVDLSHSLDGQFDFMLIFVNAKAEVDAHAPAALQALKPGGLLWFAHPKKSAKVKTDISRDVGWDVLHAAGWEAIASISIDDTWSGIRFRPKKAD